VNRLYEYPIHSALLVHKSLTALVAPAPNHSGAGHARGFRGLRFGYASRKCSVALKAYTTGMGMTDAVNKDAVNTNMRMNRCRT